MMISPRRATLSGSICEDQRACVLPSEQCSHILPACTQAMCYTLFFNNLVALVCVPLVRKEIPRAYPHLSERKCCLVQAGFCGLTQLTNVLFLCQLDFLQTSSEQCYEQIKVQCIALDTQLQQSGFLWLSLVMHSV